ncbi:hypothetical protein [Actinomadura opuntiae]|uniref:hypothetical protein n=1 Tax=Actinomadura sp. OS1-43 TaxID=604315 RepID=UPI00255B31C5|nr:hypothetical protein [Actinomadura sp. OS1-43]MDL4812818.1 hypothetical protein [Actinomadura sp. OS1-43]
MAVDAEGAVREWLNARADLVGPGRPIPLGAHLTYLRSPGKGTYAYLQVVAGSRALSAERPVHAARVSAMFHGTTRETSARAAVAYATALEALEGFPTAMGAGAICHTVADISGPLATDEHESNREQFVYVVDADFYLSAAADLTA